MASLSLGDPFWGTGMIFPHLLTSQSGSEDREAIQRLKAFSEP